MALRSRDDLGSTYGFSDFLKTAGGYSSPVGAGFYMFRLLFTGTVHSVVIGTAGASIGAAFVGTAALPFLVSACGGFLFGAIGFYIKSINEALVTLDKHPRLLQLHLDANFPQKNFMSWRRDQLRSAVFANSWVLRSMLVVSFVTAQPALERIMEHREQALIEEARAETDVAITKDIAPT